MKRITDIFEWKEYRIIKMEACALSLSKLWVSVWEPIKTIQNKKWDSSVIIEILDWQFIIDYDIAKGILVE
jgi:hypothetical protein